MAIDSFWWVIDGISLNRVFQLPAYHREKGFLNDFSFISQNNLSVSRKNRNYRPEEACQL
jgi:hypothetical protein